MHTLEPEQFLSTPFAVSIALYHASVMLERPALMV